MTSLDETFVALPAHPLQHLNNRKKQDNAYGAGCLDPLAVGMKNDTFRIRELSLFDTVFLMDNAIEPHDTYGIS